VHAPRSLVSTSRRASSRHTVLPCSDRHRLVDQAQGMYTPSGERKRFSTGSLESPLSEKILPHPTQGGFETRQGSKGRGDPCGARRVEVGGLECMGHDGTAPHHHPAGWTPVVECLEGLGGEKSVDACGRVGLMGQRVDRKSTATGTVGTHASRKLVEPGVRRLA